MKIFPSTRHLNENVFIQNESDNIISIEISNKQGVLENITIEPFSRYEYKNNQDLFLYFRNKNSPRRTFNVTSDGSIRLGNPNYIKAKHLSKSNKFLIEFSNKKCIASRYSYYINFDSYFNFHEVDSKYAILIKEIPRVNRHEHSNYKNEFSIDHQRDEDENNSISKYKNFYLLNIKNATIRNIDFEFDNWYVSNDSLFVTKDKNIYVLIISKKKVSFRHCLEYDEILTCHSFNFKLLVNKKNEIFDLVKNEYIKFEGSIQIIYKNYVVTESNIINLIDGSISKHTSNVYYISDTKNAKFISEEYFTSSSSKEFSSLAEKSCPDDFQVLFIGDYFLEFKHRKVKTELTNSNVVYTDHKEYDGNKVFFKSYYYEFSDIICLNGDIVLNKKSIIKEYENLIVYNNGSGVIIYYHDSVWHEYLFGAHFENSKYVDIIFVGNDYFYLVIENINSEGNYLECYNINYLRNYNEFNSDFLLKVYSLNEFINNAVIGDNCLRYKGVYYSGKISIIENDFNILTSDKKSNLISRKNGKYFHEIVGDEFNVQVELDFIQECKFGKSVLYDDRIFTSVENGYDIYSLDGKKIDELNYNIVDISADQMWLCEKKDTPSLEYRDINLFNYKSGNEINYKEYKKLRFKNSKGDLSISVGVFIELYRVKDGVEISDVNIDEVISELTFYNCLDYQNTLVLVYLKKKYPDLGLINTVNDVCFLENIVDNYFKENVNDIVLEGAYVNCIKNLNFKKENERDFCNNLINFYKDDFDSLKYVSELKYDYATLMSWKKCVGELKRYITYELIDYKRYLILNQRDNERDFRIYLNKDLQFYNWSSFSADSTFLTIVGKPPIGGYIEVFKLEYFDWELIGYESVFVTIEPKLAVWRGFFKSNNFVLAHDSSPNLYIIPITGYYDENYDQYFLEKKNYVSDLTEVSWNRYQALYYRNNREFLSLNNHSILAVSQSGKLMACGNNIYESVGLGGRGHIISTKVRIYDISSFPFREIINYEDFGVELNDEVQNLVRNKLSGFISCSFTNNDDYFFIQTRDGVLHVKSLPATDHTELA